MLQETPRQSRSHLCKPGRWFNSAALTLSCSAVLERPCSMTGVIRRTCKSAVQKAMSPGRLFCEKNKPSFVPVSIILKMILDSHPYHCILSVYHRISSYCWRYHGSKLLSPICSSTFKKNQVSWWKIPSLFPLHSSFWITASICSTVSLFKHLQSKSRNLKCKFIKNKSNCEPLGSNIHYLTCSSCQQRCSLHLPLWCLLPTQHPNSFSWGCKSLLDQSCSTALQFCLYSLVAQSI